MRLIHIIVVILTGFLFVGNITACNKIDYEVSIIDDPGFTYSLFSSNIMPHQSAASYGNYCIFITNTRNSFYLYNLDTKKTLCELSLEPGSGNDFMGYELYHCNQATFGVDFYSLEDVFPLLYISQRAKGDKRCFVEVFRIQVEKKDEGEDYSSMKASLIQTIYMPIMTRDNSLGNVNCVIDQDTHQMYTYSRNNIKEDSNYGYCKISRFNIPDYNCSEIMLNDSDVKESYTLKEKALNMQGGCIKNGILYIGQGYEGVGYIYLNAVNLEKKVLENRIDLLGNGIRWEPEGCFIYNGHVMLSSPSSLWKFVLNN